MNKKIKLFRSMLAMLLVLLLIMLAGCTENNKKPQPADESEHNVKSVEELLEAIKPGASITIAQGEYNLTDFWQAIPTMRTIMHGMRTMNM